MIRYISLLLFIGLVWGQEEYNIEHIFKKDNIYIKKFSEEIVNGDIYEMRDGIKVLLGRIENGLKEGIWIDWWSYKRIKSKTNWKNGIISGVCYNYYSDGPIDFITDHINTNDYTKKSGYALGVFIQAHDNETAEDQDMDTRNGALITDVVENSSAEEAGLQKGDVIVGFNGESIVKPADLQSVVYRSLSESNNKVKVLRNGTSKTMNVVLNERPDGYSMEYRFGKMYQGREKINYSRGDPKVLYYDKGGLAKTEYISWKTGEVIKVTSIYRMKRIFVHFLIYLDNTPDSLIFKGCDKVCISLTGLLLVKYF